MLRWGEKGTTAKEHKMLVPLLSDMEIQGKPKWRPKAIALSI
jgi:hypothetical protein